VSGGEVAARERNLSDCVQDLDALLKDAWEERALLGSILMTLRGPRPEDPIEAKAEREAQGLIPALGARLYALRCVLHENMSNVHDIRHALQEEPPKTPPRNNADVTLDRGAAEVYNAQKRDRGLR
jgi:hypothetical protein